MHVKVLGCAAGINVVLNAILIPKFQHNGAAIASVFTELFINVLECVYFTRLLKIKYEWNVIGQSVLSSGLMGISLVLAKNFSNGTIYSFAGCVGIGIVVYVGVNIIIKNRFLMDALLIMRKKFSK